MELTWPEAYINTPSIIEDFNIQTPEISCFNRSRIDLDFFERNYFHGHNFNDIQAEYEMKSEREMQFSSDFATEEPPILVQISLSNAGELYPSEV